MKMDSALLSGSFNPHVNKILLPIERTLENAAIKSTPVWKRVLLSRAGSCITLELFQLASMSLEETWVDL